MARIRTDSHSAELLSLRSINETQFQLLQTLGANAEWTRIEIQQHFLCLDHKLQLATTKLATSSPAATPLSPTTAHPASTDMPVAADAIPVVINQVTSVTATSSTQPSPSVKLTTTPRTNKSTPISRALATSTATPSPLQKPTSSARTTPSIQAPTGSPPANPTNPRTNKSTLSTTSTRTTASIQAPTGSPSAKLTTPHTNKSTPVRRTPTAPARTPSPLQKSTTSARTTATSQAPTGVALAAEALMDLFTSGPSGPSPSIKPANSSSAKSSPISRTPVPSYSWSSSKLTSPCPAKASQRSAKTSPNSVKASPCSSNATIHQTPTTGSSHLPKPTRSPAAPSTPATPNNVAQAAEAIDLISLASAASAASPLPVKAAEAAEQTGPISQTSVASAACPPASLPSPVLSSHGTAAASASTLPCLPSPPRSHAAKSNPTTPVKAAGAAEQTGPISQISAASVAMLEPQQPNATLPSLPKPASLPDATSSPATSVKAAGAAEETGPISQISAASVAMLEPKQSMPTTPVKAAGAAEETGLISQTSAAPVVCPQALQSPPPPADPSTTTASPTSAAGSQAVEEGPISHSSAAEANISCASTWCMVIASTVPLPRPNKKEQDFFGADLLAVTREEVVLKAATVGPTVPAQAPAKVKAETTDSGAEKEARTALNAAEDPATLRAPMDVYFETTGLIEMEEYLYAKGLTETRA
ncbi:hypothetical protein HDU81_010711 [Chytriomyces hyalinus]|nr:hypothetical protein HDU81_010711 [Chytriomyces hyalinus]